MKKTLMALAAASLAIPAVPAAARDYGNNHWNGSYQHQTYNRGQYQTYDRYGRYNQPRRITSRDHVWRGNDGRYYCERDNGTTGLIIGAAGGALLGRSIDEHGDRTLGTVLGGILGGLLGQQIDKSDARCQ
jgi:uncharacterized protein YcfJ